MGVSARSVARASRTRLLNVILLACTWTLLLCAPAMALSPDKVLSQYVMDNWQSGHGGLPQNTVLALAAGAVTTFAWRAFIRHMHVANAAR